MSWRFSNIVQYLQLTVPTRTPCVPKKNNKTRKPTKKRKNRSNKDNEKAFEFVTVVMAACI